MLNEIIKDNITEGVTMNYNSYKFTTWYDIESDNKEQCNTDKCIKCIEIRIKGHPIAKEKILRPIHKITTPTNEGGSNEACEFVNRL